MIDKARIEEEAATFFEWPDPKRNDHVTLVSCRIFAATIAEMAVAAEREHEQTLRKALQEADTVMGHDDEHTAWRERWQHLWPWGGPNVRHERERTRDET